LKKIKVGSLIGGRYKVLRAFKGGMGIVYICHDTEQKNIIVLKTFQDKYLTSEAMVNAFKREALAWVHLERHPNIVKANYVINIDDRPFIALDYIAPDSQGRNTLTHYLREPISLKQTLKWAIQFCHAMEHSAERGIAPHRDIKPDNIMITIDKTLKITDFGVAKLWDQEETIGEWTEQAEEGLPGLTFLRYSRNESIVGTVPWMAPEQFEGQTNISCDIYSFGIVLYQMINRGKRPFNYKKIKDYYIAHKYEEVKELKSKLWPMIKKCLNKNPENRYQDFKDLRIDLEVLYIKETGDILPAPLTDLDLQASEHNNKGVSFVNLNFLDNAINEFKKAIRIKPNYYRAHNNLALVYKNMGLLDKAIKEYSAALQVKPNIIETRNNLGKALMQKGAINEAVQIYRETVRIKPNYIEGHYNLGKAYEAAGNYKDALDSYKNFVDWALKDSELKTKIKKAHQSIKKLKKLVKK